jgi:exosome complex RNA-binding protein Csl4
MFSFVLLHYILCILTEYMQVWSALCNNCANQLFIQGEEMHQTEMKEMIETAISQLDEIVGSPLSTTSY